MSDVDTTANLSDAQILGSQPAAADTKADSAPATTGESPADTPPAKPEAGLQKAINRLTRQRGDAERRADRLAAELEGLRKEFSQFKQQPSQGALKQEDFRDYGEYLKAVSRAEAKAAAREEVEAGNRTRSEQEVQRQSQRLQETFLEKAAKQAADADIDMDAVMETLREAPLLSVTVLERLAESDHTARMAEYLAENPQELDRVSRLGPTLANRALDRIEEKFSKPPAKPSTNAPPPPNTVGGRAVTEFNPQKADMESYADHWKAQRAKKRA